LCATVAAAQGQDPHAGHPGTTGSPTPPASPITPPAPGPGSPAIQSGAQDGDLLAQLIAILNLAKMLHEDHMKDLDATQNLASRLGIDLKHSAAADQLHDKGSQMVSKLDALKGDAFARAYVTEMINGHKEALQMLDDAIKSAQRDEVRQHLTAVRQTVAMHLRTAEGLQSPAGTNQKGNEPDAGPDERAQFVTAR
jgi:TolA-binding protein